MDTANLYQLESLNLEENVIEKLPIELWQLKKLKNLGLSSEYMSSSEIAKFRLLLPECDIT